MGNLYSNHTATSDKLKCGCLSCCFMMGLLSACADGQLRYTVLMCVTTAPWYILVAFSCAAGCRLDQESLILAKVSFLVICAFDEPFDLSCTWHGHLGIASRVTFAGVA